MDTYYDESSNGQSKGDVNQLKRSMTLDLNQARGVAKRPKLNVAVTGAPVLSSPDLNKLKLATPDVEKFIFSQQSVLMTPTTTQMLLPRTMVDEQELYTRGFVEALNELHKTDTKHIIPEDELPCDAGAAQPTHSTYIASEPRTLVDDSVMSQAFPFPTTYSLLASQAEDDPQIVPSLCGSPPLSPINMESQEKVKLERKRQRNRIAASKCRRRKLERISRLEDKVNLLKGEHVELGSVVNKLKEQVCQLKKQVMEHVNSGCQIMISGQF